MKRRLHCWEMLCHVSLPVESGDNVDSFGFVDPQGWSSVSDVPTLAACCELQDLCQGVGVSGGLELEGDSPLLSEGGKGGQKGVLFQQMFFRMGE